MRHTLGAISQLSVASDFYLAGGTALALRAGHRRSIDLDLFSATNRVDQATQRAILHELSGLGIQTLEEAEGNLLLLVGDLHVGFFSYGYPLLLPPESVEGVAVASILDVGLMKLVALINRGSRKDFYDLYVVLQHISLPDLLAQSRTKYPYARDFNLMAMESLTLFENADRYIQPEILVDLPWQTVRQWFVDQARQTGDEWFGDAPEN